MIDLAKFFARLAARRTDELVVAAVSTATREWYRQSRDVDRSFYLQASMGISSMFALGLALGLPDGRVWNLEGDGALAMNPGALLTLADTAPGNMVQFVVVNRVYRATGGLPYAGSSRVDFEKMAQAAGITRTMTLSDDDAVTDARLDALLGADEFTFVALEVAPVTGPLPNQPLDGAEMKYRFGRAIEAAHGVTVFGQGGV